MQTATSVIPDFSQNRKSSFYYSFLILPRPKRDAIETIYAFCRFTDDIVDEAGDEKEKYALLLQWTEELRRSLYGISHYSLLNKLSAIIQRFHIPIEHFYELIKGMEMDLLNNALQYIFRIRTILLPCCFHSRIDLRGSIRLYE